VRRLLLLAAGVAAGVLGLAAGCGSAEHAAGGAADGGNLDSTVSIDAPGADAGGKVGEPGDAGIPHIAKFPVKNVVFMVKENRTFDIYFGKFPGANGVTTGQICDGGTVPLKRMLDRSSPDISHTWDSALTSYNDGGMNCFDRITTAKHPGGGPLGYQVADPADIPNYWLLAQTFVLSDNFYSSLHGPSFPNHLYTIAATSGGVTDNPITSQPTLPDAPQIGPCTSATDCPEPGEAGLEPSDVTPYKVA
jgi:phospholipase C